MNVAIASQAPAATIARRIRVMVVDDAVVVRGLFARWISAEPDLEIVASLRNAREALDQVGTADPDVVLLDIEMPDLDGLTALPLFLAKKRDLVVIMASTLTRRNAEISLKAMALGATDYIPKPSTNGETAGLLSFRRELIEKVRQLGLRAKRLRFTRTLAARGTRADRGLPESASKHAATSSFSLRPMPAVPPRVLLIGASTGGPQALNALLSKLDGVLERAPVLITQHMPPMFTAILAEHLTRLSKRDAHEAVDGEEVNAGTIYIAPGGKHMRVARRDGIAVIVIDDSEPVNFCKPSVDPLFSSAAQVWGSWALGLMLTGMGADGSRGSQALAAAGGTILAQDEASSVVWGMPGQVANLGLCSAVLPLDEIALKLTRVFGGEP
jgi:two-component system, chemotaxis family, protein-glutamate methylesterase/glutaminase